MRSIISLHIFRSVQSSLLQIMSELKELSHLKIPHQAINNSTQDFNETNFIGKGGYGRVYKGILSWTDYQNLPVAVKQLDDTGFQGHKEFYTEIAMLSHYQHENIITLIGFCDESKEMILVYEYASHGSLDTYLSDPAMLGQLSWQKRLDICVGAASALDYLHNHVAARHRIIHRDIKSANILLDENWNAKLSDFGLSKICLANQQNTFVVTNLAGTHGYCDPQYERTGILTKESDIYSFGVVLFEVLCGRLACVFEYHDERRFLHHLARTCYKNGEVDKIIDDSIKEHIMPKMLSMFSSIAYQCLHDTRERRPTIAEVALTLKNVTTSQAQMVDLDVDVKVNLDIDVKIIGLDAMIRVQCNKESHPAARLMAALKELDLEVTYASVSVVNDLMIQQATVKMGGRLYSQDQLRLAITNGISNPL